jgi:hypothetical protein
MAFTAGLSAGHLVSLRNRNSNPNDFQRIRLSRVDATALGGDGVVRSRRGAVFAPCAGDARRPQLADKHRSMTVIESNALRPVLAESCRLYIHNWTIPRKGNFAA